jgi:cytochrome P450
VLGDAARDDTAVTDLLGRLRRDANWAYLRPQRPALREEFAARLRVHLERADPDSLAGLLAAADQRTCPAGQVPHWLFAFDAAGIAAHRTLALLASHPAEHQRARAEIAGGDRELPYLRGCVQEAVRLWPTTMVVLRDSTASTDWYGDQLPADTTFVIVSSLFSRDDEALPYADRFTPQAWLDGRADDNWSLLPFSAGLAVCPGRNLVLLTTSLLVAAILEQRELRLLTGRLDPARPLPRTLDHTTLRLALRRL